MAEAVVCASCPERFHDEAAKLCASSGIQKAFGKAGDMVNSLSGKDWVAKWEAKAVMTVVTAVRVLNASRARILCVEGGKHCDLEMSAQPKLVRAIRTELEDASFRVRVEWMNFSDFKDEATSIVKETAKPSSKNTARDDSKAPDKPSSSSEDPRKLCKYFQKGACDKGENCRFRHALTDVTVSGLVETRKLCKFFAEGGCTKGSDCKFLHCSSTLNGEVPSQTNTRWECSKCGAVNKASRAKCNGCSADAPAPTEKNTHTHTPPCGDSLHPKGTIHAKLARWGVNCDACGSNASNIMYTCMMCPDYDLCEKCYPKRAKLHDSSHQFISHSNPDFWLCEKCDRDFDSEHALQQHQRDTKHQGIIFALIRTIDCAMCGRFFATAEALAQHMRATGHSEPTQTTKKSREGTGAQPQHFRESGRPGSQQSQSRPMNIWECPQCCKQFSSEQALIQHVLDPGTKGHETCPCTFCGRRLSSLKALQQHLMDYHFVAVSV